MYNLPNRAGGAIAYEIYFRIINSLTSRPLEARLQPRIGSRRVQPADAPQYFGALPGLLLASNHNHLQATAKH